MKKKAQVSVYIILGLVLLIGTGVVFFMSREKASSTIKTEIPGQVQYAGQQELRNFMDSCLQEAVFNGVELLRLQAGYIDIPPDLATTKVKSDEVIVLSNGIKKVAVGNGEVETPYWLDSNNLLHIPSLNLMTESLSKYIENSVSACVNDFGSFKDQGFNVSFENPSVRVNFSKEILTSLSMPITFERNNVKFSESDFVLRIPINLPKAVEMQNQIVLGEYLGAYLESNIKYLLSLYSYAGGTKGDYDLPPLTFIEANTNCKMTTWSLTEAKQKLLQNLQSNVKYFKIKGEGAAQITETDPIAKGVYDGLTKDVLESPFPATALDFELTDKDFNADIEPRNGDTLRPSRYSASGIKLLPLFCSVRYQFKYTLKFPMLSKATITDSPAIDVVKKTVDENRNFIFSVPIGINLCGNQNRQCTGKAPYLSEPVTVDNTKLNLTMPTETMFCNDNMKLSQPYRLRVIDAYTFKPVADATVFYRCGSSDNECLVDVSNNDGVIETKFPLCENGELYAIKDNFSDKTEIFSTYPGEEVQTKDFLFEPLRELQVEIKLVDLQTFMANYYMSNGFTSNRCTGATVYPDDSTLASRSVADENIMIASNYGPSQIMVAYPLPQIASLSPERPLTKLASGEYSFTYLVEGQVMVNPSTYNISGQTSTVSVNKNGGAYYGSYLLGDYNDLKAKFTMDQLRGASKIIFYVPVEISSKNIEVRDMAKQVIQQDGSLYTKGFIDDDCNPSTPEKEVEINVTKEDFENLIRPRLQ